MRRILWLAVFAAADQDRPGRARRRAGFRRPDQAGRTQTLKSIMGPKGAMLVFCRSADWSPFCKAQFV
jgi:hypothetical protein